MITSETVVGDSPIPNRGNGLQATRAGLRLQGARPALTPSQDFCEFLKAPLGPLSCPPQRNEHERLAAFAAYQSVLWMLADERVHGTENGDMLCVGLRRPRIGFALDV